MLLRERVDIVINMCNREINRQEAFMRCAEKHGNDKDWIKHYELQGLYMNIKDILEGNVDIMEDNNSFPELEYNADINIFYLTTK